MAYEVGDATYAPILLTFGSSVSSGSVTVAAKAGPHPQISSSYINTGNFVNRYWSVTNAGVTAPSVDIALSYSSGDMTGTPNTGYVTRMYDGMEWEQRPEQPIRHQQAPRCWRMLLQAPVSPEGHSQETI